MTPAKLDLPPIRWGIPGGWFFCCTTEDDRRDQDIEAKADCAKMEKVSTLVCLVAAGIGNKPALLKLDLCPESAARGEQNMKVARQQAFSSGPDIPLHRALSPGNRFSLRKRVNIV